MFKSILYSSVKNSQESMRGKQNFTQPFWNDWKIVETEHKQDLRKMVRAPYPEKNEKTFYPRSAHIT